MGIHRFSCGDADGWVLLDHFFWGEPIQRYAIGASDAAIAELMDAHFLPANRIQLTSSPLLIRWDGRLILVDTGVGTQLQPARGLLQDRLSTLNVTPAEIDVVLITHLHVDHIGGAFDPLSGEPLFPNARFFIPEPEIAFWKQPKPDVGDVQDVPPELIELTIRCAQRALETLGKQVEPFQAGNDVIPGIRSLALPGHTPGHTGFHFKSNGEQLIVAGDTMHDPILHLSHPEWTTNGDSLRLKTIETRRKLLEWLARDRIRFHVYHFSFPGIGWVRTGASAGYDFLPERRVWD